MAHGISDGNPPPPQNLTPAQERWLKILYAGIFMCFLSSHIDVGILSQANEKAKDEFKISESEIGLLETALYIGIVIGTIICPILFSITTPKNLITLSAFLNGAFAVIIVFG
jgi:fucose permease